MASKVKSEYNTSMKYYKILPALLLITLVLFISANVVQAKQISEKLYQYAGEKGEIVDNSQMMPHGVGRTWFDFNQTDSLSQGKIRFFEIYEISSSKYTLLTDEIDLKEVVALAAGYFGFKGFDHEGNTVAGFFKSFRNGHEFDINGYDRSGSLVYQISEIQTPWAKSIISKFPNIDFGEA
ncbi:MAG: hypothetical protein ACI9CF_000368 [Candidatus Omnitrophota bacterium]